MFQPDQDGIYAKVSASPMRRYLAYVVLLSLGALLVFLAIARPPSAIFVVILLGAGIAVLLLAQRMHHATKRHLLLTAEDIRDDTGLVLATLDEIKKVERGAFALKPSNGFTLILKERKRRAWAPGLWWRAGRRIGVGGVTGVGEAKFMAEQIALKIGDS